MRVNRLLETDYQVGYVVREMSLGPITTNIDDLLTIEEKNRLHIGKPNSKANRIPAPVCSRRNRNGLKLLWEEAMEGIQIEEDHN